MIQREELAIKRDKMQLDHKVDILKVEMDAIRSGLNIAEVRRRIESDEAKKAAELSVRLATEPKAGDKIALESAKTAVDMAKELRDRDDGNAE